MEKENQSFVPLVRKIDTRPVKKGHHFKRIYQDADLRFSAPGLIEFAKKENLDPDKFENGQWILFINREWTKLRMLGRQGILLSKNFERKFDPFVVKEILEAFLGDSRVDWDKAMKSALMKKLERRKVRVVRETQDRLKAAP